MGIFDEILFVNEGQVMKSNWIEWRNISYGKVHCSICLALDGCWFDKNIMPQSPLHEKCHCSIFRIKKPVPNISSRAECPINKFTDYIFSDKYAWNGKRDLFELLGFSIDDAEFLKEEFEKQAVNKYCDSQYTLQKLDMQGQRINIDIDFHRNGRKITFASGWMVREKGLLTNNTPLGD